MDVVLVAIGVAGLLIGATGTWSPCGFSMIETIGPVGHEGGMPTTLAASATFAPFAVLGGAITFGLLALLGEAAGAGSTLALTVAAVVALAAAVAEARGIPIVPQVRRQLPVGWRSSMPMPLAAAGYGVLLGLGFTTFVLSYGVWALMGIVLVVGDPLAGLVAGVAFGIGRAVPIVVLAPLSDKPSGRRACDAMAMRPGLLRGARIGDAVALLALAVALAGTAGAQAAAKKEVKAGTDPSTAGPSLVFESSKGEAILRRSDGSEDKLPGHDPATGGPWVATIESDQVVVFDRDTLNEVGRVGVSGADALAVSKNWLAVRHRGSGRDQVDVLPLGEGGQPGAPRGIAAVKTPSQVSRPALDGNTAVVAVARSGKNMLVRYDLREGKDPRKRTLIATADSGISAPSVAGKHIAYIRTTRKHQSVMVKSLGKDKGRIAYKAKKGPPTLWNTAIAGKRVLVTVLRPGGKGSILSVGR